VAPPTHYELLGLRVDATQDEIRGAYRALARRHHPDTQSPDTQSSDTQKGAGSPSAGAGTADGRHMMAAINGAWAVLGDPVRRQAYDAELGRPAPGSARPMGANGNRPGWDWQPLHEELDDDDLDEEPYGDPPPRRPADSMVMTPVLLVGCAVALFFLSTMVQSAGLRTVAILLLPIAGLGFVAAPLFVMVRSRSRES